MTSVPLPSQITVGSFFLETLTTGMYESPLHCLREYVQNGFDAINEAVAANLIAADEGKITVSITGSGARQNISIHDNGAGAPLAEAVDRFVSLGASRKRPQRHAGFRGIGRLAGIAYCTTLKFTTKAQGEDEATVITFDCAKIRAFMAPGATVRGVSEVIRECVTAATTAAPAHKHYTEVEMIGLIEAGIEFADREKLLPYLGQYAPTDYSAQFPFADQIRSYAAGLGHKLPVVEVELKTRKDRTRVTKLYQKSYPAPAEGARRDPSVLSRIEMIGVPAHGWFGWFGISNFPGAIPDVNVMSLRFRQKNIQIGDNSIVENIAGARKDGRDTRATDRIHQRWTVGEIFITNPGVVPNARRDGFEDNAAWRQIQADVEGITQTIAKLIRSSSTKRNLLNKPSKAIAEQRDALKAQGSTLDEVTRRAVDAELAAQLEAIQKAVKKGADVKEAAQLIAAIKEIREAMKEAAKSAASAPTPPPQDGTPAPGDGRSGAGAGLTPSLDPDEPDEPEEEEEPENGVLAIVRDILIEHLGEERAAEIMQAIYARVDDDD
jgi:hypothetical protein